MRLAGLGMALLLGACEATEVVSPSAPPASAAAPVAPPVAPTATPSGDDPCTAALPTAAGAEFAGVVRHVIDGDSLCVGPADGDGSTWIEVRLMDFDAPEHNHAGGAAAEETLTRLVLDRAVECVVTPGRSGTRSWDRTHAVCRLDGAALGDLLRGAGVDEGGN
ncbi:MAG: nuclease [Hyphomonadaceae bacterium JAD_PAG50586_4]|nr:MAG: nuclease [Hyphomonadaceae bacterium JAD_PAG50586_4]